MIEFIQSLSLWQFVLCMFGSGLLLWWIGFFFGKGFSRTFWQRYWREIEIRTVTESFESWEDVKNWVDEHDPRSK